MNIKDAKKGSVLLVAVIISTVIAISIGSFINVANNEMRQSNAAFYMNAGLNLAEAGVELAMFALHNDQVSGAHGWDVSGNVATQTFEDFALAGGGLGLIKVRIRDKDTTPIIEVQAQIDVRGGGRTIEKQVQTELRERSLFTNGLVAKDRVVFLGNNVVVDSYDSSYGPWGADLGGGTVNKRSFGSVGSISVVEDAVVLNNVDIYGFVATGGQPPSIGNQGKVTTYESGVHDDKRITTDFSANFKDIEVPTSASVEAKGTINGYTELGDSSGQLKHYLIDNINLSGEGKHLKIVGPVILEVIGDISVAGNGEIIIDPEGTGVGKAEIYVGGNVDMKGNSLNNTTNRPENMLFYGTGLSGQTFDLGGTAGSQMAVYAPDAKVLLSGSSELFGAVVANEIRVSGGHKFHYDEALANLQNAGTFRLNSWRELIGPDRIAFDF